MNSARLLLLLLPLVLAANACAGRPKPPPSSTTKAIPIAEEPEPEPGAPTRPLTPAELAAVQPVFVTQIHRLVAMLHQANGGYPATATEIEAALIWKPGPWGEALIETADSQTRIGPDGKYRYMPTSGKAPPQLMYMAHKDGASAPTVAFYPLHADHAPGMDYNMEAEYTALQALFLQRNPAGIAEHSLRDLLVFYVKTHEAEWPTSRADLSGFGLAQEGSVDGLAVWWDPLGKKGYAQLDDLTCEVSIAGPPEYFTYTACPSGVTIPGSAWRVM